MKLHEFVTAILEESSSTPEILNYDLYVWVHSNKKHQYFANEVVSVGINKCDEHILLSDSCPCDHDEQ